MKKQKMIRWLAWAVAGIACVAGGIHVNQKYQEREAAIRAIEARAQAKSQEEEDLANGILTWNGKKYRRNTAIRAILCIGVDTKGEMEAQNVAGKGGDADALFLVAQDAAKDEAQIVLIPRNTMTEIEVFDYFGNPIGTETKQLTLAYAFGDGREKSCELTVGALSKLLFGLQIDGYFMKYLGIDALIIGAIASIVLGISFYFTRWIGCISVLCIIIGALTGTWVSFGARKFEIEFEDLASLEKDKMTPVIRLIYIAVASLIFALLMNVGLIDVKIGNVDISKAFTDIKPALVIGVLCGLVESKIGIQVYNKAVSLLVDNSEQ